MDRLTLSTAFDTLGVIAILPGELPNDRVIEIADALLAAPILAVEIVPNGPATLDTVQTFRQRAGDNMLVGAARVESAAELDAAIAAGAQFASSMADFNLPLLAHAKKQGFFYIPTVHSPGQTLFASKAGSIWQKIRDDIDVEGLEGMTERAEMAGYRPKFIINQLDSDNITFAAEAGANLVTINDIYLGPDQPQSDIITRARAARSAWLNAAT